MTDRAFIAMRKRLWKKATRNGRDGITLTCPFPNNDVPEFLKELDRFERQSAKTKLLVKSRRRLHEC